MELHKHAEISRNQDILHLRKRKEMGGHWHDSTAGTQNQGNHIGDRSCVRQSKLYRQYESGNQVKELLGTGHLQWDVNKKQGAYKGQKVYDHMTADHSRCLLGDRGQKVRKNVGQDDAQMAPEYPQYGEFYDKSYSVAGAAGVAGAAPPKKQNILSHNAHPFGHDALDEFAVQQQQQRHEPQLSLLPKGSTPNNRRLEEDMKKRLAAEASEQHVFGNSSAASILKTRPW